METTTIIYLLVAAIGGFVLGWVFASVNAKRHSGSNSESDKLREDLVRVEQGRAQIEAKLAESQTSVLTLSSRVASLETKEQNYVKREAELESDLETMSEKAKVTAEEVLELNRQLISAQSSTKHLNERLEAQEKFMNDFQKRTKSEFEALASQILDSKTKVFSEQTERNLEGILKPLKEKISTFEKKVDDSYGTEAKERFALKAEVEKLIQLNDRMQKETTSLTQALKGDSKFQGDWGELVLETILQASGLREGAEYSVQREHKDEDGGKFKPDVVVNLPESKHIVVDSKVSLKAYDEYRRCETEEQRKISLVAHIKSVRTHIEGLSGKHYSKLKGINSPEFVFLFMPIEPAYLLVVQNDPEIASKAWERGIALVTATTLFTSLKTVASIWRLENQNKNALQIANEGARLYDKFVGFLDDFEKMGKLFDTGRAQYESAMNKLKNGNGSVFKKMEQLRELGASPTKRIRPDLLDGAESAEPELPVPTNGSDQKE